MFFVASTLDLEHVPLTLHFLDANLHLIHSLTGLTQHITHHAGTFPAIANTQRLIRLIYHAWL